MPAPTEFKYEIIKNLGVLSTTSKGWTKEINLISWNDATPKYDIRDWGPNREKIGKGITLSEADFQALKEIINKI